MLGIGGTCLFLVTQSEPVFLVPLLLLVATGWALFLVVGGPNRSTRIDPFHVAGTMAALALLITGALIAIDYGGSLLGQVALVCGYAGVGVVAVWGSPRWSGRAFLALLLVHVVVALVDFHSYDPRIDVQPFLEGGIDALWSGSSPYGITIPNVFDAADTAKFYGPGIVDQGRVLIGYPYLPSPLLLDSLAHVVGEVRLMHLASLLGTAAIIRHLATDRTGRALAVLVVAAPVSRPLVNNFWVELVMTLLLALSVWAMCRDQRTRAGIALGLLLASKQNLVVVLPSFLSVWRAGGRRAVVVAVLLAAGLIGPFLLWDPRGFWRSAVEFQFVQPFREDAMSLLPGLVDVVGPLPDWFLSGPSLVLGLAVSTLVAWRTRPGPTAFALGVGLSLLVTVLLSKQAFTNYFGFIGAALLLAATTWQRDSPTASATAPGESARVPGEPWPEQDGQEVPSGGAPRGARGRPHDRGARDVLPDPAGSHPGGALDPGAGGPRSAPHAGQAHPG